MFSWFESNSKYYIAFPLLTGGELLAKLNGNGRFTEEATAKVLVVMLVSTISLKPIETCTHNALIFDLLLPVHLSIRSLSRHNTSRYQT